MKIDKIIFSSSEEFSPFWNLQSFIWKEIFNIEPVCILWGKVENTDMSDKYGTIIEKEYNPELVKSFQITWSKFYNTILDPEAVWMIGDMDLYPLQTKLFVDSIKHLDDDSYTHLASNVVTDTTYEKEGGYLPAYYHVAKGSTFAKALSLSESSFEEQVHRITNDGRFTYQFKSNEDALRTFGNRVLIDETEYSHWLTDEKYTSFKIFDSHKKDLIKFETTSRYKIEPYAHPGQTRIDRCTFTNGRYRSYNEERLKAQNIIDIHCQRPYEVQKEHLLEIMEKCYNREIDI